VRLALVRLSALGDVVHTWPLALELKRARPDLHLTWIVEEPLRLLVEGHPAADGVVTVASRRWRRAPFARTTRAELGLLQSSLRALAPELCLDVQGTVKSAVVCRMSGAPRRVGLARPWRRELLAGMAYTETLPVTGTHRHVVRTNLELVRAVGGTPPEAPPAPDGRWLLAGAGVEPGACGPDRPYAVILPGTGRAEKVVPASILAEVALELDPAGLETLVAWGPGEQERAEEVTAASRGAAHLAPPTSLRQLVGLLAGASLVLGGDTGPVHLAASLGVATVGVFIATDPGRNGPRGDRVRIVSAVESRTGPPDRKVRARPTRAVSIDEILPAVRDVLAN